MSYTLTIGCGCLVYVACHPRTQVAHTRIIERRGVSCPVRLHDVGFRLQLWELLPEPAHVPIPGEAELYAPAVEPSIVFSRR